jgi:hypothetical protein
MSECEWIRRDTIDNYQDNLLAFKFKPPLNSDQPPNKKPTKVRQLCWAMLLKPQWGLCLR